MRYRLLLAAFVLSAASSTAFAGVVITSHQVNVSTKEENTISGFIEADRLKIVTPGTTVVFRGDLNRTWVISTPMSTYVEITPEVVTAFAARLAAAQTPGSAEQQKLQERLAKLPPEQRALAEQQLRALGKGAAPGQVAYAKTGQAKTASTGRCEVYGKSVNGQKQEELCIAPISSLGLSDADFAVLTQFNTFMGALVTSPVAPRADYFNWADMNKAIGFSGIPLESTLLANGQASLQDSLQKIERTTIAADAFDLPAGLTKRELATRR